MDGECKRMEQTFISENGVTIYSYPNENLHSFCIALYVKAGCLYETEEENGITHFIEHLIFRNIDHLMNHTLYRTLDQYGLSFDASTYKEFVQFTITGSPQNFPLAAELITKAFHPLVLNTREIDLERQRIKAEIREYDDKSTLDYFSNNIVWEGTSLMQMITGKKKTLNKIGKKKLNQAHASMFTNDLCFFYLTGSITKSHLEYLGKCITSYQIDASQQKRNNVAPVPEAFFQRKPKVYLKKSDTCYVRFSFDLDTSRYSTAELDLLYDILFCGHSCMVYQELSEKRGLIYSHDSSLEQYKNIGLLYFSFEVQSSNLYTAVKVIIEKLKDLKNGIQEELSCVIAPYVDNAYIMMDNASELNWTFAYENHILNCGYHTMEERIHAYQAVTSERLTQIAQEIFCSSNLTFTLKGKKKKTDLPLLEKLLQTF